MDSKVFRFKQSHSNSMRVKKQGRPEQFSRFLIQMLLMLKIRFRLPYRALEGLPNRCLEKKSF
ncbi:MAG: hypothetical protein FJZ56_06730 [Chlamydiae bacterium]|nr:hypothetical protein [Chlamydiota bacterium]